jgi:hypothetical protein
MATHCERCHITRVIPLRQQMQVVEVVDDELNILKADGLISGELNVKQGDTTGGDNRFMYKELLEHLEEKHTANPPS